MTLLSEMLADSPNGCWPLAGTTDESGNTLTLTAVNAPAAVASFIPTVSTSASDFVRPASAQKFYRADGALVDVGDVFTLEAWVRCDVGPGAAAAYSVINKGQDAYQMALWDSPVVLLLSRPNVAPICQSTVTLTCDGATVYHCVCTKNGATVALYVNGVDVTGSVTDTTYTDNAAEFTIGSSPYDDEKFDGRIQMVALYPTALSAARVLAHYNAGIWTPETNSPKTVRL